MSRLATSEREVILTIADDEHSWTVFTDSTRRTKALLRIASRWGIAPERMGVGWQFTLPESAIRAAGPASARKLAACRRAAEASQKARIGPRGPRTRSLPEGQKASDVP